MASTDAPPRRLYVLFGLLALIWGASFLFIKVALGSLTPPQVATGRLVFGAVTLSVIAAVRRRPLPRDRYTWLNLGAVAVLLTVVPFNLFSFAETRISSGLASIWNATTPLLTMLLALMFLPGERPTRAKVTGLAIGALGVLVVLGAWRLLPTGASGAAGAGGASGGTHADLLGQLACLGATSCYAASFVVLRRLGRSRTLDPVTSALLQVGPGALVMLAVTPAVGLPHPGRLTVAAVAAVAALGVLGTGVAYAWNAEVVAGLGATTASTVTYLTPVVGVALGIAVLGERPQANHAIGAALVVLGIAIGQGRLRRASIRPRSGTAATGM